MTKDNEEVLEFGFNYDEELHRYKDKSTIQALPATEDAGRSQTATLVISDENAFHPYAEKNFTAIQPTISKGSAKYVAISTANGTGNFFATVFKQAQQKKNNFKWFFLPYWLRPGRDQAWYEETKKTMFASPTLFFQEYPNDPEEAFIASGGCIFDTTIIREMENSVESPKQVDLLWRWRTLEQLVSDDGVQVWVPPNPSHSYVMWTDFATAEYGEDYSCTRVMDVQTKEDVAAWHGKIDEAEVCRIAYNLGRAYNWAFYGIERNGVGINGLYIVTNYMNYPLHRLYHHRDYTKKREPGKKDNAKSPGFPASRTMNTQLDKLGKKAVSFRESRIRDIDLLYEMKTYVEDPETRKVEAKPPDHDDRVKAWLGCLYLTEQPEAHVITGPAGIANMYDEDDSKGKSRLIGRRRLI